MDLAAGIVPVESFRHEVTAATFVMEPAHQHHNAGCACHSCIGIYDLSETFGIGQLLVPVVRNAVELQEPVLESGICIKLTGSEFASFGVPAENGIRPCTTTVPVQARLRQSRSAKKPLHSTSKVKLSTST